MSQKAKVVEYTPTGRQTGKGENVFTVAFDSGHKGGTTDKFEMGEEAEYDLKSYQSGEFKNFWVNRVSNNGKERALPFNVDDKQDSDPPENVTVAEQPISTPAPKKEPKQEVVDNDPNKNMRITRLAVLKSSALELMLKNKQKVSILDIEEAAEQLIDYAYNGVNEKDEPAADGK